MSDLTEPNKQTVRMILKNFVVGLDYDLNNLEDLKQLDQVGYEIFKAGCRETINKILDKWIDLNLKYSHIDSVVNVISEFGSYLKELKK